MRTHATWIRLVPWMTAWAVAMAFLESAVVIYLRELYYPDGFKFPLAPVAPHVAVTEVLRELATMVMLLAPAALVTRKRLERFAWFSFCFGVWDIFYYVFLKIILDWPASWLEPDILFLVPVAWSGPVLAPCIISVGLISLGCTLLWRRARFPAYRPRTGHWVSLDASAVLFLYTFLEEPVSYIRGAGGTLETMVGHRAMDALGAYVPEHYAWWVFLAACVLGGATLGMMLLGQGRATVGDP